MVEGYPVMLDVQGKKCVVVGGGTVAERKLQALIEADADIAIVSPAVTDQIDRWIKDGVMRARLGKYRPSDLEGAFLAIAAADDPKVNRRVHQDALERRVLLNVADRPDLSSMHNMAVMRRGKLTIAISTSGASPGLAGQLKARLEEEFGREYEIYLDFLGELREKVKMNVKDRRARAKIFESALKWDILDKIRDGTLSSFREELWRRLESGASAETD